MRKGKSFRQVLPYNLLVDAYRFYGLPFDCGCTMVLANVTGQQTLFAAAYYTDIKIDLNKYVVEYTFRATSGLQTVGVKCQIFLKDHAEGNKFILGVLDNLGNTIAVEKQLYFASIPLAPQPDYFAGPPWDTIAFAGIYREVQSFILDPIFRRQLPRGIAGVEAVPLWPVFK